MVNTGFYIHLNSQFFFCGRSFHYIFRTYISYIQSHFFLIESERSFVCSFIIHCEQVSTFYAISLRAYQQITGLLGGIVVKAYFTIS